MYGSVYAKIHASCRQAWLIAFDACGAGEAANGSEDSLGKGQDALIVQIAPHRRRAWRAHLVRLVRLVAVRLQAVGLAIDGELHTATRVTMMDFDPLATGLQASGVNQKPDVLQPWQTFR